MFLFGEVTKEKLIFSPSKARDRDRMEYRNLMYFIAAMVTKADLKVTKCARVQEP
jgi:hypothetical protein